MRRPSCNPLPPSSNPTTVAGVRTALPARKVAALVAIRYAPRLASAAHPLPPHAPAHDTRTAVRRFVHDGRLILAQPFSADSDAITQLSEPTRPPPTRPDPLRTARPHPLAPSEASGSRPHPSVREAVLPRSKMWTLAHYPELPTHTWGLLSGKRENKSPPPRTPFSPPDLARHAFSHDTSLISAISYLSAQARRALGARSMTATTVLLHAPGANIY